MRDQTDDLLDEAFAGFTAAAGPYVHPAGMAPVRATVRRRRTTRLAVGAVAAAIAVVAPFAYLAQDNRHTPVPMTSPSASPSASPSPSPTLTSPNPSAGAAGSSAPTTTQQSKPVSCDLATPTATFTPVSLCNATITMPSGGCSAGKTVLTKGTTPIAGGGTLTLRRALQADVNGDGTPDVVAMLDCYLGDPSSQLVVAFTRSAGSTAVKTIGLVVGPSSTSTISGATDLAVDPSGAVRVFVENVQGSDGLAHGRTVNQWRTYAWDGTEFAQTGGHTSFTADQTATKLDLTVGKVTLDGVKKRASVTVTVHNRGTTSTGVLTVYGFLEYPPAAGGCPAVDPVGVYDATTEVCTVGELAAGKSKTVTLTYSTTDTPPTFGDEVFVQLRVGDQEYAIDNKLQVG